MTVTGQSGVEAEDLGYLHPAMAAQAATRAADPRPWQQRFDALKPDDLLGEPNWMDYADAAIALIDEASSVDLSGLRLTANPHMTALRKNDGDSYRQITEAVAARAKALNG